MIIPMVRLRVMGPRPALPGALSAIQDIGLFHLSSPRIEGKLAPVSAGSAQRRLARNLQRIIADSEAFFAAVGTRPAAVPGQATSLSLPAGARLAQRARRQADRLRARLQELAEEVTLLAKYQSFFSAFEALLRHPGKWAGSQAFHVLLRPGQGEGIPRLRQELTEVLGEEFELWSQPLEGGEVALLLMVPPATAARVEQILAQGRIQEIPVPTGYGGGSLGEAVPRMLERLEAIPRERRAIEEERARLAAQQGPVVAGIGRTAHDLLLRTQAEAQSGVTAHVFVLEGWIPSRARTRFEQELVRRTSPEITIEEVAREQWEGSPVPVVLNNPRLFRPFELIVRMLPLPRYGSIDPTPFVAVFFPMFFGVALGDIGYGAALGALALLLRSRSRPGTALRSAAEIAGACALFSVIFGVLYGEFLGNLGRQWFGLHPLWFDREEAVIPFLALAVGLGLVHIVLGLLLGVAGAHSRRERLGHGVAALMVILIVIALLAAVELLPAPIFTPAVITLLVAFPILVIAEGLIAPVELLSTLGNILSYARIMALGTASVMLAVVANQMTGAMGSAIVGVLFALLFHLVNFALGLFSPTIHALRLHYVEFFGKFYSPGGVEYRPLAHWTPAPAGGGSPAGPSRSTAYPEPRSRS